MGAEEASAWPHRARQTICRSRHAGPYQNGLGQIKDAVSASGWTAFVEDRSVPGFWKGDLIEEPGNSCFATLVYRHYRHVMLRTTENKDPESVVSHPGKNEEVVSRTLCILEP
jgi:IS30 family transposase